MKIAVYCLKCLVAGVGLFSGRFCFAQAPMRVSAGMQTQAIRVLKVMERYGGSPALVQAAEDNRGYVARDGGMLRWRLNGPDNPHILYFADTGQLSGLSFGSSVVEPSRSPAAPTLPDEVLLRAAREYVVAARPNVGHWLLTIVDRGRRTQVSAAPVVAGTKSTAWTNVLMDSSNATLEQLVAQRPLDYRLAGLPRRSPSACFAAAADAYLRFRPMRGGIFKAEPELLIGLPDHGPAVPSEMTPIQQARVAARLAVPIYRFKVYEGRHTQFIDVDANAGNAMTIFELNPIGSPGKLDSIGAVDKMTAPGTHVSSKALPVQNPHTSGSQAVLVQAGGKLMTAKMHISGGLIEIPRTGKTYKASKQLIAKLADLYPQHRSTFGGSKVRR